MLEQNYKIELIFYQNSIIIIFYSVLFCVILCYAMIDYPSPHAGSYEESQNAV